MNKPSSDSKKLTLVYLQQLFLEKTDEFHFIRMPDILSYLAIKDIYVDRRTIYTDLKLLNYAGFEIIGVQEKGGYKYHHPSRLFDVNELKFLIDSVAASKFLTEKKSKELINKIKVLGGAFNNEYLDRNVLLGKRIKSMNDKVFKNLDNLYNALNHNSQISFQYMQWNREKKLIVKKEKKYNVSPYAITLNNDNYYLIAYDHNSSEIRHYRIDKMKAIQLSYEAREGQENFKSFNLVEYTKKTFGMFSGKEETIRLQCQNFLAGVFIDRFGEDVAIRPDLDNQECFIARVTVYTSPQFYAWLFGLGKDVKILSPKSVIKEYTLLMKSIFENYKESEI